MRGASSTSIRTRTWVPMTVAVIGFPAFRAGGIRREFQQYALPSGREPGSPRCTLSEESI